MYIAYIYIYTYVYIYVYIYVYTNMKYWFNPNFWTSQNVDHLRQSPLDAGLCSGEGGP